MRKGGTLYYMFSDHLGSTSLTTDANGNVVSELRYKPWGETRYAGGNTSTKYQYTAQYSYESDFGLYFYNARWYDPMSGRMAQADTIIPPGTQGYDRYAYANNAPTRYIDPSGHKYCDSQSNGDCTRLSNSIEHTAIKYRIRFKGNWSINEQVAAIEAVERVGARFATERGNGESASEAFRAVYGHVNFTWGGEGATGDCANTSSGGCTSNSSQINFWSLSGHMDNDMTRMVKNVVHELGHAFDKSLGYYDSEGHWIQASNNMPDNVYYDGVRDQVLRPNMAEGELSPNHYDWQQHPPSMDALGSSRSETFADIFIAWVYDAWNHDPIYSNNVNDVRNYMNGLVP